ncbi:hypothetical protein RSAG8_12240, partial [Rhizoctonia solani AG-8 WAC10335]
MSTVISTPQHPEQSLPPASLIEDAHTQLTRIFNSPIPQCPTKPKCDTPTNQSSLILYCPIEGGESIIDATVQELARRAGAAVTTIDIVQQINEREGSFWKASGDDETSTCSESKDNGGGYFKMDELISTTKLIKSVKAALLRSDVPELKAEPASHRNIVYLRDFGFLATFSPACYWKILSVVQKSLPGINDPGVRTPTVLILGASPLLVKGGLFQTGAGNWLARPGPKGEAPGSLGEDSDAEKLREQRLSQQHEMWKDDSLIDHIHEQLARTSVLDERNPEQCSRDLLDSPQKPDTPPPQQSPRLKRLPTCVVVPEKRDLKQERWAREKRRLELNRLMVQMALFASGGEQSTFGGPFGSEEPPNAFTIRCEQDLLDFGAIKRVADRAISSALASDSASAPGPTRSISAAISWDAYCAAWKMSTVVSTPQHPEQSLPSASLIEDAHTQLTRIFNSPIPQCPTEPKCDTPTNQSSLILYCPIEGGESIIDSTVQELARRAGAAVTTIDIVQQINEREGNFWKASGDDETDTCPESKDSNGAGYFKMDELISTTKLIKSIEAALLRSDVPEPKFEPASHRNIVYLRDLGFLATFSPACYGKILSVIQKSLPGIDDNTGVLASTALILGASPLLVRGGLFQKGATKGPAGGDTSFDLFRSLYTSTKSGSKDEPPGSWGEDNDAEKLREQRLSQQHEMWKSDSLIDHIYEQLARTSVLDLPQYVGEDEKKVDALFKLARQLKPCLIFIDEVDALFAARMSARDSNSSRWRTDMLTQFTQEMDGMLSSDVIVIGASNRPFDLDDAILRRLPCRILVDLPDEDAREAILRILLKDEQLEPEVDLTDLAGLTPNFSGSDLKHLCVMAAFESAKQLANISWAEKGKRKSTLSPLGILNGRIGESDSDEGSMTNIGMAGLPNKPSSDLVDNSTQSSIEPQARKLAKRHFTHALKQVRASTSEAQSSIRSARTEPHGAEPTMDEWVWCRRIRHRGFGDAPVLIGYAHTRDEWDRNGHVRHEHVQYE